MADNTQMEYLLPRWAGENSEIYEQKRAEMSFIPDQVREVKGSYMWLGLHFGQKRSKISLDFEDLSRNSVFIRTEVKP